MASYTITSKSHFRHLWLYILLIIGLPAVIYFLMIYKKGYFEIGTALLVGGITFVCYSIPVVAIHIRYYFENKNAVFTYNASSGELIYEKKGSEIKFRNEDIQKITVVKSRPIAEDRTPAFAWDYYNYATIELKDGQVLKISSLLVYELDKVVKFENTEIKKTFYAWMP